MRFDLAGKRIWVAGHNGMVGSAVARRLGSEATEIVTAGRAAVDLTRQREVETFIGDVRPDAIVLAAARVGGIGANAAHQADFLSENLQIAVNVFAAAHAHDVDRLLFLGSSCAYPRLAVQPITEDALLTGPLEPTNEGYAIAKIAGIALARAYREQFGRNYIVAMPCNLYGPGDNFDPETAHVLPALIGKAHAAKRAGAPAITLWGTGTPRREFLHVEDCADALVFLLAHYFDKGPINVGSGKEWSILDLAELVCAVVGFEGGIVHDRSRPDGTPRKLMDSRRLRTMGWAPSIGLREGIGAAYAWFLAHGQGARAA